MRPQYSISIQPVYEPITLAQASDHLRVDSTDDQISISDLISVGREYFDEVTGRASAPTTYVLTAETWEDLFDPTRDHRSDMPRQSGIFNNYVIPIQRTPLVSVSSIKYYAPGASTLTTMSANDYRVITSAEPGRIQLVSSPPAIEDRIDAIQITFVSGNDCPPAMSKHAIKMLVGHLYENRVSVNIGNITSEIPYTLRTLIENQKIGGHF
jgi:hypothetical protein